MQHDEESPMLAISFRAQKIEMVLRKGITARNVKEHIIGTAEQQQQSERLSLSDIKLLFKGKVVTEDDADIMELVSKKSKSSRKPQKRYNIMAMGRPASEVQRINETFAEGIKNAPRIRDDLTAEGKLDAERRKRLGRKMLHEAGKRNRIPGGQGSSQSYGFGQIRVLPNLPEQEKARSILTQLANDPGVLACMAKHKWNVGSLSELYPDGRVGQSAVCVMGLNKNKGQEILLRIRTDDLKGFRKMLSIRKVLFHELAHNVYSEHDNDFFRLMRQIEKECNEMDWTNGSGLTTSVDSVDYISGGSHRLGGRVSDLSARDLAARAAMGRLTAEEEEIQNNCGCGLDTDLFLPDSLKPRGNNKSCVDHKMDTSK